MAHDDDYGSVIFDHGPLSWWRFWDDPVDGAADEMGLQTATVPGSTTIVNDVPLVPSLAAEPGAASWRWPTSQAVAARGATAVNAAYSTLGASGVPFSVTLWCMLPSASAGTFPPMFCFGNAQNPDSIAYYLNTSVSPARPYVDYRSASASRLSLNSAFQFARNSVVHHMGLVFNGTSFQHYVDGVTVGATGTPSAYFTTISGNTVRLGLNNSGGTHWEGSMQEVALFARNLSAAEIAEQYDVGLNGLSEPPPVTTNRMLIGL